MFVLLNRAPGDPVALYVNVQSLSPEEVETVRHEYQVILRIATGG